MNPWASKSRIPESAGTRSSSGGRVRESSPEVKLSPKEQFADALDFATRKYLTAEQLRLEIPMTRAGQL